MKRRRNLVSLSAVLSLAVLLSLTAACSDLTPWVTLAESRYAHEVTLLSHEIAPSAEREGENDAVLLLRVVDTGSTMELPCLTIDVIFSRGTGVGFREVSEPRAEIDLTGFREGGKAGEFEVRVPAPIKEFDAVQVRVTRPHDSGGHQTLCEAAAVHALKP
jgi:hypothetical protein